MKITKTAAALVALLTVAGCASDGGGSSSSGSTGSPAVDLLVCFLTFFLGCPNGGVSGSAASNDGGSFMSGRQFSTWNETKGRGVIEGYGLGTLLSYDAGTLGISAVHPITPAESAYVNAGNVTFSYDMQGRLVNLSLGGGGGDPSALTDQRVMTNLSRVGQSWLDVGYLPAANGAPSTPFVDLPARYVETLANPYELGWNYQSFGAWNVTDPGWTNFGARTFGSVTPANAVPTAGTAHFTGKLSGFYVSPGGTGSMATADVSVDANFSSRTLGFASTGTTLTRDLTTPVAAPNLNLAGSMTYSPSSNTFNGTLTSAGGTLSGATKGQFYGPAAQELGGVFTLKSGSSVETFSGAYGGKR